MTDENKIGSLTNYTRLGASGLRVSPLCLGTMTFGEDWGWGNNASDSRTIFDRFLDAGGNFIDTADGYTGGHSEEMLGEFMADAGNRDRIVLATKFTFSGFPGDPNACGNGRKNIYRAVEASLRRLKTDYIDLYWLHFWDGLTPVEEVMETLDTLVREGKVRYLGLSDTPAWYLSRAQTIAELRGRARIAALQLEYSLVERNIEREHIPAALELGMGVLPWSPLASGFLSGKYTQDGDSGKGEGRLDIQEKQGSTLFGRYNDRNWKILAVLLEVAKELGKSPAQVALNWITKRPGVTSAIIGATKMAQLEDNLAALEFDIPEELSARLEEAGRPPLVFPYNFYSPEMRAFSMGGVRLSAEPPWFRP
jgi:aryl-alcohol dehydrogenase-like predicted oxidoreductase